MAELTDGMIERRFQRATSNPVVVNIPGLSGLGFAPLTAKERGVSARAYSSKLIELHKQGGFYAEALVPKVLKDLCEQHGLDVKLLDKKLAIQRKLMAAIPGHLAGPYDQLTDEEVQELSPEERAERDEAIVERGREITEYMHGILTEEDREQLAQINQIEQLREELYRNTAEYHARRHQMVTEILLCARKAEQSDKPYFASEDDLEALPVGTLADLFLAWKQFREGLPSDFFSR